MMTDNSAYLVPSQLDCNIKPHRPEGNAALRALLVGSIHQIRKSIRDDGRHGNGHKVAWPLKDCRLGVPVLKQHCQQNPAQPLDEYHPKRKSQY